MFAKLLRRTVVAALAASALAAVTAQADPFFDDMLLQSRGFGLEMVGVRLHAIAQFDPIPEGLDEVSEGFFEDDLPRFMGTLRAAAPFVADGLTEALEAVEEGVEDGDLGLLTLAYANAWQALAYDVLVPTEARTPAYWGAIAADLLLADGGVGEAMEEAIAEGELWEYPGGWAALQRIEWIWGQLAGMASADEASFGRQYLDMLHELLPTAQIPESFPANPEEAEAPAQSMVGVFETVVDASLYTGRDLGRLASHLADLVAPACELYAAGETELASETAFAVRPHYRKHLRRLLDLVAPEVHGVAGGILDELVAEEDERPADLGGACRDLHDALVEARSALGG
jgi:hypothetical protein